MVIASPATMNETRTHKSLSVRRSDRSRITHKPGCGHRTLSGTLKQQAKRDAGDCQQSQRSQRVIDERVNGNDDNDGRGEANVQPFVGIARRPC